MKHSYSKGVKPVSNVKEGSLEKAIRLHVEPGLEMMPKSVPVVLPISRSETRYVRIRDCDISGMDSATIRSNVIKEKVN